MIFLPCLAVVFLPNDCLFLTTFIMSSTNIYPPKKWPDVSEDLRNLSFRWEKITEECIKNAFTACGIVDKDGSYDVQHTFLFSSGLFCLKTVVEMMNGETILCH